MPIKNDEKIIRNILKSFKDKLVSKKQLERAFRDVLQDKYPEYTIFSEIEKDPVHCHRRIIAEQLESLGAKVEVH